MTDRLRRLLLTGVAAALLAGCTTDPATSGPASPQGGTTMPAELERIVTDAERAAQDGEQDLREP
ncbi:hypothetical protein SAMN04489712_109203 [Thermomonospora echinospora]|uniref:Uncharacterized protein n=1 Tax=Thermomonospora echinospora TaxID=1992 RepID=A0A1H6CD00_9ACTN|nr:hypothetical protein [Thermomonospora echinospora]SEG70778.1 hypothetical protein SAMN04489712_109203 [Thermomonospora echinospora]